MNTVTSQAFDKIVYMGTVKQADGQVRDPRLVSSIADGKCGGEKSRKGEREAGIKTQEGRDWS